MRTEPASPRLLAFQDHGAGPALLLIHGLMITGEMFEPVIAPLAAGHRVIVPDLRGHGQSRSLPPPYTAAQLALDLSHLLDHLDIRSAAVLGYSQGGAIAQQVALDFSGRCNRLLLACTYSYNMATAREKLEGYLLPILLNVFGISRVANLVIAQGLRQVPKKQADRIVRLIAGQDGKRMVSAWKAAMAFDSRLRLPEIACPTLIIAGSNDRAVPLHHAMMLNEGIANSQLALIEGADHALIWSHAAEFVRIVEKFLQE